MLLKEDPVPDRVPPIVKGFPHLLHGGDYNPEQWIRTPQVWDEDMRLMRSAGCNVVSIGIFSWAMLEPEEGRFEFGWLDTIFEKLQANGIKAVLATPGGARPAWMAFKYPEVLRVDQYGRRQKWGGRHNHCFTSPVFREKCRIINSKLAERYEDHPALALWHVNNEYNGECHCDLCQDAFRAWLRARYNDDLDTLNHAWWSTFWSHTITDWKQIEPPSRIGETQVHGHTLDWKRFCSDQHIDCFKAEAEPLRRITPSVPVTTNFMGIFHELDYYAFAKHLDVISWDSYPSYHDRPDDWLNAITVSFLHSQRRAMLNKPFLLMESAPAMQNYKPVCKLKRPGLHVVEGLQAIAHGSDSVQYFQWRKSRGGFEKFHGAVVDHFGTEESRVFREVADLGRALEKLDDVVGTTSRADVAILYDYQNRWAIDDAAGPRNEKKNYLETCVEHYRPFWSNGVTVDVIGEDHEDLSGYKLLIAPMLYMLRPGVAERIERFVEQGGTFVTTYFSGVVNESDLCFLTGFPGPLRKLMGAWAEETDTLYDDERVAILPSRRNASGLSGKYEARHFCDLIHAEGATVLATYAGEFYKGRPAVTVNRFGKGRAYYIASRNDTRFHADFYGQLIDDLNLDRALGVALPEGITAAVRTDGERRFVFLLSFSPKNATIDLGRAAYRDVISSQRVSGKLALPSYQAVVLEPVPKTNRPPKPMKRIRAQR